MGGKNYLTYESVYAMCPFYKGEDRTGVRCEGVEKGSSIVNRFPNGKRKERYATAFCRSIKHCEDCAVHRMMTRVYTGQ